MSEAREIPPPPPLVPQAEGPSPVQSRTLPPAPAPARAPAAAPAAAAGPAPADAWSATRPMLMGYLGVAVLIFGVGLWGSTASISGAVIAPAQIEVEAKRQVIQHPDGGVVGEILVRDGDRVEAGQPVLRLDETLLRSELNIIEGQLFEIMARRGRLAAERDGRDVVTFDPELVELAAVRPDVAELIEGQLSLFKARRETRAREVGQLRERQAQIREQIVGIEAQRTAMSAQRVLIRQELEANQTLFEKGLAEAPRILALQREQARLDGQVGELISNQAQTRGRIAEIEIQILQVETKMREEAITTLRDLEYREVELREKRLATTEKLARLEIRSPVRGIVYGNTVHAIRSVVRPAEPIMYVVPVDSELVVTARVDPLHIDEVHVGQDAVLRFSAFSSRTTPELMGRVIQVSADAFTDDQRGVSYYTARVQPKPGELDKIAELELLPGMPVEAFIQTGDRTLLNYLVRPFTDYIKKAFREE